MNDQVYYGKFLISVTPVIFFRSGTKVLRIVEGPSSLFRFPVVILLIIKTPPIP